MVAKTASTRIFSTLVIFTFMLIVGGATYDRFSATPRGMAPATYKDAWPSVNVMHPPAQTGLVESTYSLQPGVRADNIPLKYNAPVELLENGKLNFAFETGTVTANAPNAFQQITGKRSPLDVHYHYENGRVGFSLGHYNRQFSLTIAPSYTWHTFFGSSEYDRAQSITLDSSGNIYIAGTSYATWNGPNGEAPLHTFSGLNDKDIVVMKLNSAGIYQWHTFYGSSAYANAMTIDENDNIYISGKSYNTWNGPGNIAPIHAYMGFSDIVVIKLSSAGVYQWHTFYGSTGTDESHAITNDKHGNLYVSARSSITWNGPTAANLPLHDHVSGSDFDIAVIKLSDNGTYQWHTFYGGPGNDIDNNWGAGMTSDANGNVYLTSGSLNSWDGPSATPPLHAHTSPGTEYDMVVLKLNSAGAYQWHTFYGSLDSDVGLGITMDAIGNLYVVGTSLKGWNGPGATLPLHNYADGREITIFKLNNAGVYQWHTFYGSSAEDEGKAIASDAVGNLYITGQSFGLWKGPGEITPLNWYAGNHDMFVLQLNNVGAYQWHSFSGSIGGHDEGLAIAATNAGAIVAAGYSDKSWDGPSPYFASPLYTYTETTDTTPTDDIVIIKGLGSSPLTSVTINQASGQLDPTSVSPINFTATFSNPIDPSTFTREDLTLGGTAGATIATIGQVAPNNGTTFNIAISGMISSGIVTVSLDTGKVTDLAGNSNNASTSADNNVAYLLFCSTITQIPQIECQALEAFYKSTNGDSWTNKTGWLQTNTPCNWYGITCSSGNVTQIDLAYNQLAGTLPPEIGNLTFLNQFVINHNQVTGNIPTEFGNLTLLKYIDLNSNHFDGTIPDQIGNLTSLVSLDLGWNQFSGNIPAVIGNLTSMQNLGLQYNSLSGNIPVEIGNLTSLQILTMDSNELSGSIPDEIGKLTKLKKLNLWGNHLDGNIPAWIGNLTELDDLNLQSNQFTGEFPVSITKLINLSIFAFDCEITTSNSEVMAFLLLKAPSIWGQCHPTLTVTLEQAATQPDPTTSSSVNFTMTFSKRINISTLIPPEQTDFTLGGTAPGTLSVSSITEVAPNDGTTFNVAISSMTGSGTVTASLNAGKVTDLAGNTNSASISNDNSVNYRMEMDTDCSNSSNIPDIQSGEYKHSELAAADDVDLYKFQVTTPYTTITATLTPPVNGNFGLYLLYESCQDDSQNGPVNISWESIGRRYIHIGRRYIHIGSGGDPTNTIEVHFNVGKKTGYYYLAVAMPASCGINACIYDQNQYALHLELEPSDLTSIDTLIIYNPTRFANKYHLDTEDARSQMMDKLVELAAHPKVKGLILQLDQFSEIMALYNTLDNTSISNYAANVKAANDVSEAIRSVVRKFMEDHKLQLTSYVVIVGDDGQIPFRRVLIDPSSKDNHWGLEQEYFKSLDIEPKTSIGAALMDNKTLSDNYYGDYLDRTWAGNWPGLAVGRLLDTPARITKTIDAFLNHNGVINLITPKPGYAAVAGYYPFSDSAKELCNHLAENGGLSAPCALLSTHQTPYNYTSINLFDNLIMSKPNIAAYFGDTNHAQIFVPSGNPLTAEEISAANFDPSSSLWWLIGCQSGLVLPDYSLSLAQALADHGITYVGNTGWAYGSDGPPIYSELLYQMFADQLTRKLSASIPDDKVTVGEALRLAKQDYYYEAINNARLINKDYQLAYYDDKVVSEATLYGLPMLEFKFPNTSLTQTSIMTQKTVTKLDVSNLAWSGQFHPIETEVYGLTSTQQAYKGATYYSDGQKRYSTPLNLPVLPRSETSNITWSSFGYGKGAIWVSGSYVNTPITMPLVLNPKVLSKSALFDTTNSNNQPAFNVTYPLMPVVMVGRQEFSGEFTNRLTFQTGQYIGNEKSGILRRFSTMKYEVGFWNTNGPLADDTPPTIGNITTSVNGTQLRVQVPVTESGTGVYKILVTKTYVDNLAPSGSWDSYYPVAMSACKAGTQQQTYNIDIPLSFGYEVDYFVQVMDCAGNVSVKMGDHGQYYKAFVTNSIAVQDGWISESGENTNLGGVINATTTTFNLGDNSTKKQYRSILSFLTSNLPDNAVITSVSLRIQQKSIVGGGNPITMFQGLMADVKNGFFGTTPSVQAGDFQAASSQSFGPFSPTLINYWYSINLNSASINKLTTNSGLTQIRLRFKLDDNNNTIANYLSLYSGNAAASRPQLVINYYTP